MKAMDFKQMVESGKDVVVEFMDHPRLADSGTLFEKGMRAYLAGISAVDSEMFLVQFEEREFRAYNKRLETPIWRDETTGEYTLKFSETIEFQKYEGSESIYMDAEEEILTFKLVDECTHGLYSEYNALGIDLPYVSWLEKLVLGGRSQKKG